MVEKVSAHYGSGGDLADKIAEGLQKSGKYLDDLKTVIYRLSMSFISRAGRQPCNWLSK